MLWQGSYPIEIAHSHLKELFRLALRLVPKNHQERVQMAFSELIGNAVRHTPKIGEPMVHASFDLDAESLTIEIINEGICFMPRPENFFLPHDPTQDHGRGLFLARAHCDSLQYQLMPNATCVIARWRLDPIRFGGWI